jgi:hypothetical protein
LASDASGGILVNMGRPSPERTCERCEADPLSRCGRCGITLCFEHTPIPGRRCTGCEAEWELDGPIRRTAKQIFVLPVAIIAGGAAFGLLLPLFLGGVIGPTAVAGGATLVGTLAGGGTCRVIDHSARMGFLREHARQLPPARLLTRRKRAFSVVR